MLKKKKKEELTAEEYEQKVQKHMNAFKQDWLTFFRTGLFMYAALFAIIIASIAWFVNNNKVTASGVKIQAAGSEFDLAAAADDSDSKGVYDSLLNVSSGTEVEINNKKFLSTEGKGSISWAITDDSNIKNNRDRGIEPGSRGKLTFYIISHKDGPLSVTLNLDLIGYTADAEWSNTTTSTDLKKIGEEAQQLLEGHLLLFAGYDSYSNSYRNWISEDAESWTTALGEDNKVSLSRDETGSLIWETDNATKDTAYPVTIYWIWPEMLESYLRNADTYTGGRPLLFPNDSTNSNESVNDNGVLPNNLFENMCEAESSKESNRYFRWGDDIKNFSETVTEAILKQMRTNFNPVIYGTLSTYYNEADQYLGENVRYAKLILDAQ